jgi:hypothetical protein
MRRAADTFRLASSRSDNAVDRNGCRVFRKDFSVKGLRPPKAALRALDRKILSKLFAAVAIDGTPRRTDIRPDHWGSP